ncbi:NfeD family protein [Dolosicoccus paucivorans]|uniref:NfeD family protein n=1 Tax=Dolosicoccus paucivorans TaxID=84521 RepID=UPI00087F43AA|nr:NfeD family protein [Dolosicoccus paucivorans]SDI44178.1 NfeD-like C-terminal, partner-binding [Dolosicoccus paucivorans]
MWLLALGTIVLSIGLFSRYQGLFIATAGALFIGYFMPWQTGEWFNTILFLVGIAFLIVEIYIPGFGLAGIVGALSVVTGLYFHLDSYMMTSLMLLLMVVCSIGVGALMMQMGRVLTISPRFILNRSIQSQSKSQYYTRSLKELAVGQQGIARTALRPIGEASFNGKVYEVTSDEGLILQGSALEIVQLTSSKIIVKKVK